MSKGSTDNITSRKLGMIAEARKAVDSIKDDKPAAEPKRKTVSLEEALKTEMQVNQALIDLLIAKGIISQEELIEEIKKLRRG